MFLIIMFLVGVALISCKESIGPIEKGMENTGFALQLTVKDQQGNAVPNLKVFGGNKINVLPGNETGSAWATAVYKAKLVVQDTGKTTILFQDSIYIVRAETDIAQSNAYLGTTDQTGIFRTEDKIRFPQLYDLPRMILTSEVEPQPMGTFSVLDSSWFILYDTLTKKLQRVNYVLNKNNNAFTVIWQPQQQFKAPAMQATHPSGIDKINNLTGNGLFPDLTWKLSQNYPNPFSISTAIQFTLQANGYVTLFLYDLKGNQYKTLVMSNLMAGQYMVFYNDNE